MVDHKLFMYGHDKIRELEAVIQKAREEILMWQTVIEHEGEGNFCGHCGVVHGKKL